jgi:hypothetical protein
VKINALFWQELKIITIQKGAFFMSTLPKEVLREMIKDGNLHTARDLHSYLRSNSC